MNNCAKIAYLLKCARLARHLSTALRNGPNFYELLGVSPKATTAEIKNAYFEKTKLCHPDVAEPSEESLTLFRQISEAYEVLGSPTLRKEYDENVLGISMENADDFEDPILAYRNKMRKFNEDKMYSWTKEHLNTLRKQQQAHHSFSYRSNQKSEPQDKGGSYFDLSLFCVILIFGLGYYKIASSDAEVKTT